VGNVQGEPGDHLVDVHPHRGVERRQEVSVARRDGVDAWVRLQRYGDRPWRDLIEVWHAVNGHLEAAARAVRPEAWDRECIIGGAAPVTLAMLIADYMWHLLHHLEHIGAAGAPGRA